MHFHSVLSVLLVPIHTYLKRSHLKQSSCSVMIRDIQLDSKVIVVVKGNPKHPFKTIHNVQSSASPLAIKTKLHSEKIGQYSKQTNINFINNGFSFTTLSEILQGAKFPAGSNSILTLTKKRYIFLLYLHIIHIYIFFNTTVVEGKNPGYMFIICL